MSFDAMIVISKIVSSRSPPSVEPGSRSLYHFAIFISKKKKLRIILRKLESLRVRI